ncbi:MAG TPA: potassium-transporting ATPase subunit KdpA [Victivallales bacterium]|nr:potassium-transporting ATPase subunit KdpA [Victivallales bacterium]
MTALGIFKIILFVVILILITKPLGIYIKKVVSREKTFLDRLLVPIEKSIYKICFIDSETEQNWKQYTVSLLLFSLFGIILTISIQMLQYYLPMNPEHLKGTPFILSLNTAISFVTNTNWQAYAGESTLSYTSQVVALSFQQFVSAATGIAVVIALTRAFARKKTEYLGNFWVDLTRISLWILFPLCIIIALFYVSQGVPQNISAYITAHTIDAGKQILPQGPIASFEAIKSLGTNGGGFLGANSMHPYENPNGLTNFVQVLTIFAIGVALTYTFGLMVKSKKQGWTILIAMLVMFLFFTTSMYYFESQGNPRINKADHIESVGSVAKYGQNMEGKETRFGIADSVLYASVTTSASDGGVNAQMETLNPMSGGIAMFNMAIGELIVGGVGTGLYNMLIMVILTVFIAGLMVGRSPEFLGKKIGIHEMKWAIVAVLISPFCVLFFTALTCFVPSLYNGVTASLGPHGFSRLLYAFISASNNNGSAFNFITNTDYFNLATGTCMLLGRFVSIAAIMAVAGSIAKKKITPASSGTFPTTGVLFIVMLIVCILIVGGLNFFPALALGPITEHLMLF